MENFCMMVDMDMDTQIAVPRNKIIAIEEDGPYFLIFVKHLNQPIRIDYGNGLNHLADIIWNSGYELSFSEDSL